MPDVNIKFAGNESDAVAALARLERKYANLENKIGQVSRRSRKDTGTVGSQLAKWSRSLGSVLAGYLALPAAIGAVVRANQAFLDQADQAGDKYDSAFRKFRVQTGLRGLEAQGAQNKILDSAERNAATSENATAAAVQLVSSGFSVDDAIGPALESTLQALAASGRDDIDPTSLVQAAGQFLAAQGLEKNAENLDRVLVAVQRLFKGTDLQLTDLGQLSGKSIGFAGRVSPEETLAAFDVIREKQTAEVASTSLQAIVGRLSSSAEDKTRTDYLDRLGLTPDDVDLVGERIGTVLDRLAVGFESLPEKERAGVAEKLFGESAKDSALGLIRDRGKLPGLVESLGDREGFQADVEIGTSGRVAAQRRSQIQSDRQAAEQSDDFQLYVAEAQRRERERGTSNVEISARTAAARVARNLGSPAQSALAAGFGRDYRGGHFDTLSSVQGIVDAVERQKRGAPSAAAVQNEAEARRALIEGGTAAVAEQAAARQAAERGLDLTEPPPTTTAPVSPGAIAATDPSVGVVPDLPAAGRVPGRQPGGDGAALTSGPSRPDDQAVATMSRLADALEANTRATEQNTNETRPTGAVGRPPKINRNAHTE